MGDLNTKQYFNELYQQALAHQARVNQFAQNANDMGLTGGAPERSSKPTRSDTSGPTRSNGEKKHTLPPKIVLMQLITRENLKPRHATEAAFAGFRQQDWMKLASIIVETAKEMEGTQDINKAVTATAQRLSDEDLSGYLDQLKQFNKENKKEQKKRSKGASGRYAVANRYGIKGGSFY
jgi:hypothetical protein